MTPDTRSPLGYCEPPISDFDDVREIGVVVGRKFKVKINDGKTKEIRPKARIISVGNRVSIIAGGTNETISSDDLINILVPEVMGKIQIALAKNRMNRKQKINERQV